jgi:hypothetical protein
MLVFLCSSVSNKETNFPIFQPLCFFDDYVISLLIAFSCGGSWLTTEWLFGDVDVSPNF